MKKLRKAVALLVGTVMALSSMPQMALAEKTDDAYMYGWYVSGPDQNDNIKAYVDNNESVSGSNSVYIQKNDQNWEDFSVDQNVTIPAGEYTLSLWVKGGYEDATTVLFEDGHWQTHKLLNGEYTTGTAFTRTEGENGWVKLEKTLTVDTTTKRIRILTVGWANGFYVDDISLVKEGTTNNILTNGSFEMKAPTYTSEFEPYFQGWTRWDNGAAPNGETRYACVTDEIAYSGDKSLVIKHKTAEGGMMVVQEGLSLTGAYTLSYWAIGQNSTKQLVIMQGQDGLWQGYSVQDVATATETDGDWTKYTVNMTVPEENTQNAIVFCSDGDTDGWFIDDISIVPQGTTTNVIKNGSFDFDGTPTYTSELEPYFMGWGNWSAAVLDNVNTFYCVTNEIAHSGNNSVVIRHADSSQGWKAVTIAQEGLSYGAGTYTLSFWAAGNYANNLCGMTSNGDWWDDFYLTDFTVAETDGDWTKYTIDFTVPEGKTQNAITLMSNGDTQGLYLDDISLVKDGTTENLLKNGSFDDDGMPDYKAEYTTAYEDYFQGWEKEYGVTENGSTIFSCVTNGFAHSGSNSVVLRHIDESQNDRDLMIKQAGLSLGEGTYTLSFWAAGTVADLDNDTYRYQHIVWLEGLDPSYRYVTDMTTGTTDGDWSYYTLDFTVPAGSTVSAVKLSTRGHGTQYLYIDDFNLVKSGTTENILKNGSFDDDGIPDYTTAYEDHFYGWERDDAVTQNGSTVFSCVIDEMAHSGNHSMVLRHVDGSQNDRDLMIKQTGLSLGEGTYTLSFWAAGTVADWDDDTYRYQHIVWLEGLDPSYRYVTDMTTSETDGDWRKYTLDFTVPAGSTVSAIKLSTRGHGTVSLYVDDFSLVKQGTTNNILKNGSFDDDGVPEYKTGLGDYFAGWNDWSAIEKDGNLVFMCVTDEKAHSGNKSFVLRHVDNSKPSNICIAQNVPSLEAGEYTISFWSTGAKKNGLQAVTLADPWKRYSLESFTVTEIDGEWSKYELTVTADGGETAISFPTDGQTEGWFIDDISLVKSGTTENLVKNGGFEYKGLDGYYVSEPKVMKIEGESKREITSLESGLLEVSIEVTNYTMGDDFAPILIAALYNGDKYVKMEYGKQISYERQAEGFVEDELCFTVEVPQMTDGADYSLKIMCWDGLTTIIPLMDALELE